MSNNFNINKNQPLVSIITPIYNAEKYLDRCLKSTINQTYGNIEIILINDGSTDNTKSICYHYESTNNNVVFINRDRNMGTIVSRKEGIKKATGEFIMFVDADDYILPNTVEKLIGLNANFSCDLLIFNMYYSKTSIIFFIQGLMSSVEQRKIFIKILICFIIPLVLTLFAINFTMLKN